MCLLISHFVKLKITFFNIISRLSNIYVFYLLIVERNCNPCFVKELIYFQIRRFSCFLLEMLEACFIDQVLEK